MSKEEINALWVEYQKGPDYFNVRRWAENPNLDINGTLFAAFKAGVLCATDPDFLKADGPPEEGGE